MQYFQCTHSMVDGYTKMYDMNVHCCVVFGHCLRSHDESTGDGKGVT